MISRVVIESGEDSGYIAHCPAIPGCPSQGQTFEEALENIKDAIRGCLEAQDKELIPSSAETIALLDVVL